MVLKQDRKLAAIMFTDIVGFSSMMSKDEAKAVESLKLKESILNPLITNNNGKLVKYIGDGTLSYYNSAIDAVRCAIELQKSFQRIRELNCLFECRSINTSTNAMLSLSRRCGFFHHNVCDSIYFVEWNLIELRDVLEKRTQL